MANTKEKLSNPLPYAKIVFFATPIVCLLFIIVASFVLGASEQYSWLAQAFLHGQLNFLHPIGGAGQDPVFWHGKIYWSEGLFPALLLLPFVAVLNIFHLFFYQAYLQWAVVLGVWFLVFKLARHLTYSKEDSAMLAFAFTLASAFIGTASVATSWYFGQDVTVFLLFWSLYEYLVRKRRNWWLIGTICGLVLLTRVTAAPILIFYILEIYKSKAPKKLKTLARLCIPVAVALAMIGLYNYLRFQNPFHGGYSNQLLFPRSAASEAQGLFSLTHIPSNLYGAILGGPTMIFRNDSTWTLKFPYIKANIYGMSIFVTSPYFLYLFTKKFSSFNSQTKHLLVAALITSLLLFSYFGIGIVQYGYRYSLDFLPELFLVFMIMYRKSNKRLSVGMKALILGSSIFNLYLLIPVVM